MGSTRVFLGLGLVVGGLVCPLWVQATELLARVHYGPRTSVPEEQAIRELLERYRLGYEQGDPEALSEVYADFTPALARAARSYYRRAKSLAVKIEDMRILKISGREILATFTRQDSFIDARSGKRVRLKVRLTRKFVRRGGLWKMLASAEGL